MKKMIVVSSVVFLGASLLLGILIFPNMCKQNISLKATVIETTIEPGSVNEPIFGDSKADFENFVMVSNMNYYDAIDVKENPEDYLFITYTIRMENVGEVKLVLKDLGQIESENVWLLNDLDGHLPILQQDTATVNVCLVGKNCEENINSSFNIPLVFDISYEGIFSCLENTITIWAMTNQTNY